MYIANDLLLNSKGNKIRSVFGAAIAEINLIEESIEIGRDIRRVRDLEDVVPSETTSVTVANAASTCTS